MASTSSKQSSRFSTFKVFKFSGSKPPPPPPKDPNYLYSVSNRSALSFSNQSLSVDSLSQPPTPHSTSPQSVARSPSPAPSRATQSPASSSALGPNSAGSKKGFFNFGSLRKRSLSRSSQRTTVEDVPDDESISMPWNFQHHIHVDEGFHGIPPGWTASLAEAGFSESEILAIQQARRARSPAQESTYPPPSAFSYSRSQSPSSIAASTTLVNPRRRSSSLRSNASLSRSERSGSGKHAPPPLPIATRKHSASGSTGAPPVDQSFIEIDGTDSVAAHSDANFVYVDHSKRDTTVTITPERSLADSPEALTSTSRAAASSSSSSRATPPRPIDTTRSRSRTPPRKTFRVVNETPPGARSPPPAYASPMTSTYTDGMSPSLTSLEAWRPLPQEKMSSRSPPQQELPPVAQEEAGQSTNGRANRPPKLSILPPRLSLRKDTLEDLSSWTEALFSAIPSATESSPTSAARTLSATPVDSSKASSSRIPPWQQLTNPVPNILLNSSPREEEDEDEYEAEADLSFSASPLYNELMGMMQDRPALQSPPASASSIPAFDLPTPDTPVLPSTPASPGFAVHLDADARGRTMTRDHDRDSSTSQLTLRLDPRRNSDRDSNASSSTITHATIVSDASVVRRAPANMIINTAKDVHTRNAVPMDGLEESDEEAEVALGLIPDTTDRQLVNVERQRSRSRSSGSSSGSSGSGYGFSDSPAQALSVTSGSNSQEDAYVGYKSPGLSYLQTSPALGSPLREEYVRKEMEVPAQLMKDDLEEDEDEDDVDDDEDDEGDLDDVEDATVEAVARAPSLRRPSIVITTDGVSSLPRTNAFVNSNSNHLRSAFSPATPSPTGSLTPSSSGSSPSPHAQRYPGWVSEVVKPLAEFLDDSVDPRDLFVDLQEIAEGESGSVFSARMQSSPAAPAHAFTPPTPTSPFPARARQDVVAMKCIPIVPSGSPKLSDLKRELELLRGVRHPNVLKMERLYVDLVDDSLWIAMELMDRSVADVLGVALEAGGEDIVMGEKMVARFVWDVLLALSYIRKQHIAHRDLRSDNLLLNRDGVLKLADFSSAIRAPPGTPKSSEMAGVIYWQAPEVRTGLYDPMKVDVWSLGATAWELVQGEPPFSDVEDTRQIGHQLPPLSQPEIYSRSFHDFLHLCSQPVASRPDPDELLNAHFIRTACPRSAIVQMLAQCKAIEEQRLRRLSIDSQGTFTKS